jgi:OmpA-OmpF porin, OOP family
MTTAGRARFLVGFSLVAWSLATPQSWAIGGDKDSVEAGFYAGQAILDEYGGIEPDSDLLFGARLGTFMTRKWSLEVSYQRMSAENDLGTDVDVTSYRGNLLSNFMPGMRLRPFITAGLGFEATEIDGADANGLGANVGAGARAYLTDHFGIRVDGRYVYTDVGGPIDDWQGNIEATFGVLFAWGGGPPADTDRDGVPDRKDDCPGTPVGATVDLRGCPKDTDGDRVWDGLDVCPDTPAGCPVDEKGCPLDTDGDGVIDCQDKCADTPKGCKVDATGCPKDADGDGVCDGLDTCESTVKGCAVDATGCPKDADGDGVCDGIDKCDGTAKGCTVDATGCPKDTDGDKVCDGLDKCPGTPAGQAVDSVGCQLLFAPEKPSLILEGVTFENDSAQLKPESAATLDSVATSLVASPDVRVEVQGHTDSTGSDAYYLVSKGVPAARLEAKGYGESQPIAKNDTGEGRARNRRVELKKL